MAHAHLVVSNDHMAPHRGTLFSPCRRYRYRLYRNLRDLARKTGPGLLFVMFNPSVADHESNDATIRRCIGFARSTGSVDLWVANLFGLVATNPAEIYRDGDPCGPRNTMLLEDMFAAAAAAGNVTIICAWGALPTPIGGGVAGKQDLRILDRIRRAGLVPHCLALTQGGYPSHPLRLPRDLKPVPYITGRAGL